MPLLTPQQILQQYWGYAAFRGKQEEIINAILQGQNVLALLPTGGGKSVCYQVPALCMQGLCIVVSPLIALMKDQVEQLEKKGIRAAALHSGLAKEELINILQKAEENYYAFLYVSPERLQNALVKEYLPHLPIVLLAVDEAHCISQWGFDFRPSYLQIPLAQKLIPKVPCIAVTATATEIVQADILQHLQIPNALVIKQSFEKPNLSFSVFKVDSKINKLIDILHNVKGAAIVYCKNRKGKQQVAQLLQLQGFVADYYHGGLTTKERSSKQHQWMNNKTPTIVCTNAFGMGIDKADVRVVVHYDIPDCVENYYQEAGRAGRDLQKSYAVLLYTEQDVQQLKQLPNLRFPPIETIKHIYQCLADYLHIPVGIGKDNSYAFSIAEFIQNFKLDTIQASATLKILEQQEHIIVSDAVFRPSTVQFITTKESLFAVEQTHPQYNDVVKFLLRSYQGILDNAVTIHEKQIAKHTQQTEAVVIQQLQALHQLQLLSYKPATEKPFIQFLLNRASANFLLLNESFIQQQKSNFEKRVQAILQYATAINDCRSNFLASYFNMALPQVCGICNNCLQQQQTPLQAAKFKAIENSIFSLLQQQNVISFNQIVAATKAPKNHVQTVLLFLVEQQQLQYQNNMYSLTQ
jgi:ATP-dependent DNA helicase RecQ